jgi:hypothetical protein
MRRAFIVLLGVLVVGVFANSAFAADPAPPPRNGYIEVCKAANPQLTDGFRFAILDAWGESGIRYATIGLGTCTSPIPVVAGDVKVSELGALTGLDNAGKISDTPTRDFISATTTAVGPTGPVGTNPQSGFDRVVNVPASPNGTSGVVTVTYTDTLVTGVIQVCKKIVTGSGLTGSWQFTITGGNGYSSTQTVPAGACSPPVTVPAGKVKVQETGDASEAVTEITATQTASATNAVLGPLAGPAPDLDTATVVAAVSAGDASKQTIITYTNTSVRLKLCKWVDSGTPLGPYPFTFPSVTGNPGPVGPIGPVSITPKGVGESNVVCVVVGSFRAGTTVQIVEGIVPGSKVGAITVNPEKNAYNGNPTIVPDSLSLPNRTVTVVLGKGETVVTYRNVPAKPGLLKICKVAGTSTPAVPPGTVFTFTVTRQNGAAAAGSPFSVPTGSCVVVGTFPFNETLSIVEGALPNIKVKEITAVPTLVVVGGVNSNQPVLSNVNPAARSTSVTIGEDNITEVTFTNIDPPADTGGGTTGSGTTGGGSTGGGTTGGGSTGGGSTGSAGGGGGASGGGASESGSSSSNSSSTPVLPTTPAAVPTTIGVGLGVGSTSGTGSTSAATKAAVLKAAKLAKLQKKMTTLNAKLKRLAAKSAAAKKLAVKRSLAKQIAALKVSKAKLAKEIRLLR